MSTVLQSALNNNQNTTTPTPQKNLRQGHATILSKRLIFDKMAAWQITWGKYCQASDATK